MAVYGFAPRGSFIPGIPSVRRQYTQTSAVAAAGDAATLTSGTSIVATAGQQLIGIYEKAATSSGTAHINITPFLCVFGDSDQDGTTLAATHIGTRFDHVGTTGAMLIDSSSTGATGQFSMLEFNSDLPAYKGDASIALFMIVESMLYTSADN